MDVIYATLIIKGKKTYKQVPEILKKKVADILIALDMEELVIED